MKLVYIGDSKSPVERRRAVDALDDAEQLAALRQREDVACDVRVGDTELRERGAAHRVERRVPQRRGGGREATRRR